MSRFLSVFILALFFVACQPDEITPSIHIIPEVPLEIIDSVEVSLLNIDIPGANRDPYYLDVKVAPDGQIWLAGSGRDNTGKYGLLVVYNPENGSYTHRKDRNADAFYYLTSDTQDGFYIYPNSGGLSDFVYHVNANLEFSTFNFPGAIRGVSANPLNLDLWGIRGRDLTRISSDGEVANFISSDFAGAGNLNIPYIACSDDGTLYAAYWNAVYYYTDAGAWQSYAFNAAFGEGGFRSLIPTDNGQMAGIIDFGNDTWQLVVFDESGVNQIIDQPFSMEDTAQGSLRRLIANDFGFFATSFDAIKYRPLDRDVALILSPFNSILEPTTTGIRFDVDKLGRIWLVSEEQVGVADASFLEME